VILATADRTPELPLNRLNIPFEDRTTPFQSLLRFRGRVAARLPRNRPDTSRHCGTSRRNSHKCLASRAFKPPAGALGLHLQRLTTRASQLDHRSHPLQTKVTFGRATHGSQVAQPSRTEQRRAPPTNLPPTNLPPTNLPPSARSLSPFPRLVTAFHADLWPRRSFFRCSFYTPTIQYRLRQ